MSSFITDPIRCSHALLVIALLLSGCSGSSDSNSNGSQSPADESGSIGDGVISDAGNSGEVSAMEDAAMNDATSDTQAESTDATTHSTTGVSESTDDTNESSGVSESTEDTNDASSGVSESSMPDPLVQNSTRVEFSITVPAYQSNALQVQLTWDAKVFNANWVGDELWSASDDFPTNTEHQLVVTFSDANGGITLGQYESVFKTGTNDSEDFQVAAEQFNIDGWDDDEDGTSNIDELIAGTDPIVNEDSLLEIRDSARVHLGFIANSFEARIPEERPYDEYYEEELVYHDGGRPPSGAMHIIEINIDELGNGVLSDTRLEGVGIWPIRTTYTGTRTHSENSIQWDGKLQTSEDFGDLYVTTTSVNTVSIIDEQTRKYEETYRNYYDTSDEFTSTTERQIELIGEVIEGTSFCQPIAGTIESETTSPRVTNGTIFHTSISKEIDDQYWRVKSTVTGDESSETEYFAREFNATFQCNFVEF